MAVDNEHNNSPENRQEIAELILRLDDQLQTLKVEFEQYFLGITRFQPDKLKADVERGFRRLLKIPLKNAELNFRARSLKYKFNALETYWRRVLKEKEDGRYHKDVFKAQFRKDKQKQKEHEGSKQGLAEKQMRSIYDVYTRELRQAGINPETVSFDNFKNILSQSASSFKKSNPGKKMKFSVVIKNGMPAVETSIRE